MDLQVRIANLTADQWKKEAETIRVRLEGIESRMSPASNASQGVGGAPGMVRTPLRQSTGSGSQGRPSLENRQVGKPIRGGWLKRVVLLINVYFLALLSLVCICTCVLVFMSFFTLPFLVFF